MTGSYEVWADTDKNRLYLTLDGLLDVDVANAMIDEMFSVADELDPGFDMVNDISTFKPLSQEATDAIDVGKAGLTERKMSAVVRVIGDSVVGKMQFERVGDQGYHVATAESTEEAEELLDEFRESES